MEKDRERKNDLISKKGNKEKDVKGSGEKMTVQRAGYGIRTRRYEQKK